MLKTAQLKTPITPKGRFFPPMMPNGHWAEDIADEQYASILLLENNGVKLLWISLDAIGTGKEYTDAVRKRISESLDIPITNINIGFTHSHCAPRIGTPGRNDTPFDKIYEDFVSDRLLDGAERVSKMKAEEVSVFAKDYDGSGYYSNRNGLEKTGDTGIRLLEFRSKEGKTKGLALSYACHSTVVNFQNTRSMNSDLGGYLCRGLEKRYGIYPVVMLGAAGDMSNRCTRQGNTYDELVRVGEGLLSRMDMKTEEKELRISDITVEPYEFKRTFVTTAEERHAQIENIRKQIEEAQTADLKRVFGSALEHALREPDGGTFLLDLEGVIIRMGDIEVCTMPAELFSCFGLAIKEAMPVSCPIFWGYSNYSVGYLYNKEEAGKSFESAATNISPGVPEEITEFLEEKVR